MKLKFNEARGSEQGTVFGGVMSVFIWAAMSSYLYILLSRMLLKSDNKTETFYMPLEQDQFLRWSEVQFDIAIELSDLLDNNKVIAYDDDLK